MNCHENGMTRLLLTWRLTAEHLWWSFRRATGLSTRLI
ncbi:hypothetical protein LINPERHAP1_LOCUS35261 [Linum perenne]